MATLLEDAEFILANVERGLKDIKDKYEGKQSERIIANHVWMIEQIEDKLKKHVTPLRDLLIKLKSNYLGDFNSATNFDIAAGYCNEINKILNDLLLLYKMRAGYVDIKLKWQYNMPKLTENVNHLRHRFSIIKGQITRKRFEYEEEDNNIF